MKEARRGHLKSFNTVQLLMDDLKNEANDVFFNLWRA